MLKYAIPIQYAGFALFRCSISFSRVGQILISIYIFQKNRRILSVFLSGASFTAVSYTFTNQVRKMVSSYNVNYMLVNHIINKETLILKKYNMAALNTIKEALSNCIKRFGVTVVSLFGLFLTICIYNPSNEGRFLHFFLFLFVA